MLFLEFFGSPAGTGSIDIWNSDLINIKENF